MRFKRIFAVLVVLLLGAATAVQGATATTTTTLGAAVANASTQIVTVASATNVAAGGRLYVGNEIMAVQSVSGTAVTVMRGYAGTVATRHPSGAPVYVATRAMTPYVFRASDPSGACTASNESYLPQINPASGGIWDCGLAGVWFDWRKVVTVSCSTGALVTGSVDQTCVGIDRAYAVVRIAEVHAVAETAGTLTLKVTRQQSTEAPASGDLLTAAAIDMVGAGAVAETVKTPALSATASVLLLSAGERIGLDFTDDVAGELKTVVVTLTLYPL